MKNKKYDNENSQAEEIRRALSPLDRQTTLPEALSAGSIEALLNESEQQGERKSKSGTVRRFTALAAAAAVFALCCIGFISLGSDRFAPSVDTPEIGTVSNDTVKNAPTIGGQGTASNEAAQSDYSHILSLIGSYKKNSVYLYSSNGEASGDLSLEESAVDATAPSQEKNEYGETNVQVEGIDEADVLKTDGKYIYSTESFYKPTGECIVKIVITDAAAASMKIVSDIVISDGVQGNLRSLIDFYLRGDALIAIFNDYAGSKPRSGYIVYDITDRTKPVKADSYIQDGYCVSSRITYGRLILISEMGLFYRCYGYSYNADYGAPARENNELTAESVIPMTYNNGENGVMLPAESIFIADENAPGCFTVITSTPLDDLSAVPQAKSILGNTSEIYCSSERLYLFGSGNERVTVNEEDTLTGDTVARAEYISSTKISVFSIISGDIEFIGTASAPGWIINSYSADEYNGYFRIATCENNKSYITVFNSELIKVGATPAFGEGETMQSVRFSGSTAYAVTFLQTDPLFVIDLSVPENPVITGELKIPGFSTYLHPAGNNLVIGIGRGGNDNGTDGSAKISLFDVSNPQKPAEISSLIIENSSFNTNPHAFLSLDDGSFIVPFEQYSSNSTKEYCDVTVLHGFIRFSVHNGELRELNRYESSAPEADWYTLRAAYIGNTVYSVSTGSFSIEAFDAESGRLLGKIERGS